MKVIDFKHVSKIRNENHKKTDKILIEDFLNLLHNQQLDFNNSFYSPFF